MATRKRNDEITSAQVILRPRGLKSSAEAGPVTSANVHQYTPTAETLQKVSSWFASKGFEVGPAVGTSFSISASKAEFERVFKTKLARRKSLKLPLEPIPQDVAGEIEEVTFTPPPDFGPTSY
jgi:hypothetical protein